MDNELREYQKLKIKDLEQQLEECKTKLAKSEEQAMIYQTYITIVSLRLNNVSRDEEENNNE